jgi:hypothetical protein
MRTITWWLYTQPVMAVWTAPVFYRDFDDPNWL